MKKYGLALLASCAALAVAPQAMAKWHQGYVVEYYALQSVWAVDAAKDPTKDVQCPNGYNIPNWNKNFKTTWRTEAEVDQVINRPGGFSFGTPLGNRGPHPGMNVYRDPTLIPDPGIEEVRTKIGWGFDLDGNKATGFASPDGKMTGLDNGVYKAMGCLVEYRGPAHQPGRFVPEDASYYPNDEMRQGVFTMLIMLSGEGNDPSNDPSMKVGFYLAKEQLQKLHNNEIAPDYSYRIDPDPRFMTVVDAKSANGVITLKSQPEFINIRDAHTRPYFVPELTLFKPQMELTVNKDGVLSAKVGGYRNWKQLYWGWAAGGSTTETARQIDLVGLWNALERNADGMPDPGTGKNTAISASYQIYAVPAFMVTPESNEVVTEARLFQGVPMDVGPEKNALPLASRIRGLGGNANFYLDGAAASWPNKPLAGTTQIANQPAAPLLMDAPTTQATTPAPAQSTPRAGVPGPVASVR
jgi:hypothetical protein